MRLQPGDSIGPYTVVGMLGRGGMGEVWRARDEKLQRDVAIKALPLELAADEVAVARFEREARLLASLRHQNIAAVYGLEEHDGRRHLVMECVEGETLSSRLSRSGLVGHDVLEIARQIAEGLEAAHGSGVVHRDLKPANIRITPEGQAKILDFGLARGPEAGSGSHDPGSFYLGASGMEAPSSEGGPRDVDTTPGTILGTVPYMSPEQARGQSVDRRSDIWSFGCVLYEAVTGHRPFNGSSQADLLGAILGEEPDWEALPEDLPPMVSVLLRRCLTKDRRRRLQDIGDARVELEHAIDDPSSTSFGPIRRAPSPRRARVLSVLPWALAVGGLALAALARLDGGDRAEAGVVAPPEVEAAVTRFRIEAPKTPEGARIPIGLGIAASPTARELAIVVPGSGKDYPRIGIRRFDRLDLELLDGATNCFLPVFSADGRSLLAGGARTGELLRLSLPHGASEPVPSVRFALASSGDDGSIVLRTMFSSEGAGLSRVPPEGGAPEALTAVDKEGLELDHVHPQVLPGSRRVLFGVRYLPGSGHASELRLLDLEDGSIVKVLSGACFGRYLPPAHLVYQRGRSLLASRVDPRTLLPVGGPLLCVEQLEQSLVPIPVPGFVLSPNGTLVYSTHDRPEVLPQWRQPDGTVAPVCEGLAPDHYVTAAASPDGSTLAAVLRTEQGFYRLCAIDLPRGTRRYLTPPMTDVRGPLWSPGCPGEIVYSASLESSVHRLYRVRADGSTEPELLLDAPGRAFASHWSRDGSQIVFDRYQDDAGSGADICALHLEEPPRIEPFRATPHRELLGALSPDGRWMAFVAYDNGLPQVFVRRYPEPGPEIQVSKDRGGDPVWAQDGETLYYTNEAGRELWATGISVVDGRPEPSPPELLALLDDATTEPGPVHSDGRMLLFRPESSEDPDAPAYWNVVLGFDAELRRLLP